MSIGELVVVLQDVACRELEASTHTRDDCRGLSERCVGSEGRRVWLRVGHDAPEAGGVTFVAMLFEHFTKVGLGDPEGGLRKHDVELVGKILCFGDVFHCSSGAIAKLEGGKAVHDGSMFLADW